MTLILGTQAGTERWERFGLAAIIIMAAVCVLLRVWCSASWR